MPAKRDNLMGRRFGRLLVLDVGGKGSNGGLLWWCRCDCGADTLVASGDLKKPPPRGVVSCGCYRAEIGKNNRTHGLSLSPEYKVWRAILDRCLNPRLKAYQDYGKRGIKVCQRWLQFAAFYADMGPRPGAGCEIDRIDNDGNYEPSNCRWATVKQQARNRRSTRYIEFNGERLCLTEWAERLGITKQSMSSRIKKYGVERALSMQAPVKKGG